MTLSHSCDVGARRAAGVLAAVVAAALFAPAAPAAAQSSPLPALDPSGAARGGRPVPGPVYEIPEFTRAVARGTRTRTGRPGAAYWVQHARYAIEASLDPAAHRVTGSERVVYLNDSPDTLARLAIYLRQNVFAEGNPRRQPAPITGGVTLSRVAVEGQTLAPAGEGVKAVPITDVANRRRAEQGYEVDGTVMWIPLASPLLPHDSVRLDLAWSYVPPPSPSDGRQGREDDLYVVGYWYPQVAVYDDVNGWVADPYLLEAEFYMDPADYDVRLTVPRGWVVGATGTLANAAEVLTPATRAKLARARRTGDVVHVVEPGAGAAAAFAGSGPTTTWRFTAKDMRDFAWGTSSRWVWDATRALVKRSGAAPDTVDIHSFYRRHAPAAAWAVGGARFTRDAIEQLSAYLWPYPWPQMTSMEGVLDSGGMEYPMLTAMQPWADTLSLAGDLMHETGHEWFPMQVGSSETRYPWMDEGFTQFDVAQAMRALYGEPRTGGRPGDSEAGQRRLYAEAARAGHDMPLMWPGDLYPQDLYFIMYYDKTAVALATLRALLGEETFHRAFREYGRRWTGKHPYPYDFFATISDVAGRDLSWFWDTWFYRGWPLDQAIASVAPDGDSLAVVVEDRGLAPMPVRLVVTRAGGAVQRIEVPVDAWLRGERRHTVRIAREPAVERVEIDPEGVFPDVDRGNQVWRAGR
ncbi:MAG TPA: M1 family metallopeptidase [Longimicrobiales bacterium]|nr:M1 family metallopeptidase [Longimicrobiales bacterium]